MKVPIANFILVIIMFVISMNITNQTNPIQEH